MRWSSRARADLKAIYEYIAKESPINAKSVVREIVEHADSLAELPYLGRRVPEINDDELREIPASAWRVLYRLRQGQVSIVTLVHKRRHLGAVSLDSDIDHREE